MDDLISRQAAIEAIKELESSEDFSFNNALICAMNNIDELPSAQRWIPVKERLPDAYYLVWATDGKDVGIASFQRKGNFWLGDDNFSDYQPEVTHWMPLPEPPKEEP